MAEPVRKPSFALKDEPGILLQRWIRSSGGELELVDLPLTPELFLNPKHGDKWMQGEQHHRVTGELFGILDAYLSSAPDVLVTSDLQHIFGPRLPKPCPDISVIRGVRNRKADRSSFKVAREGTVPCLIIEVVSPLDAEIRKTDLERKVRLYENAGVREYVIIDSVRQNHLFRLLAYRLDRSGRYRPVELDAQDRFLSETTGLWFQVSPDGSRVFVFESPSGRRLLNLREEKERAEEAEARAKRAEEKAKSETEARASAEAEIARLKAELDRLRGPS